jgi:CTP synthase
LYACRLAPSTLVYELYNESVIYERHRHRYEFNNAYRSQFIESGYAISGTSPDGRLVEAIELPSHPYFIATQFHPEFQSRPSRPHPLFQGLIKAALDIQKQSIPSSPELVSSLIMEDLNDRRYEQTEEFASVKSSP